MPGGAVGDLVNMPVTGHLIGGCTIGDSPQTGVVDAYHRLFGHAGLHVVDGSAVSVNLGVNPSLTITAQAERAMALWPNRGEPDPRPPLGAAYERLAPVAPKNPVVPEAAPGALRLPVLDTRRMTRPRLEMTAIRPSRGSCAASSTRRRFLVPLADVPVDLPPGCRSVRVAGRGRRRRGLGRLRARRRAVLPRTDDDRAGAPRLAGAADDHAHLGRQRGLA